MEDNFDLSHVNNNEWKDADLVSENKDLLRRNSIQDLFKGYYFDKTQGNNKTAPPSTKASTVNNDSINGGGGKEE